MDPDFDYPEDFKQAVACLIPNDARLARSLEWGDSRVGRTLVSRSSHPAEHGGRGPVTEQVGESLNEFLERVAKQAQIDALLERWRLMNLERRKALVLT